MRRGDHWSPFFCSPITTPQSTLSTAPLYGSLTCLSLRRGGTHCQSDGCYSTSFFIFQHVKASRYGLPYLLICCTCVGCVIRCFLSVTTAETRIRLCSYLRYTAFNFSTSDFFTACVNRIRFTCFKFIR